MSLADTQASESTPVTRRRTPPRWLPVVLLAALMAIGWVSQPSRSSKMLKRIRMANPGPSPCPPTNLMETSSPSLSQMAAGVSGHA